MLNCWILLVSDSQFHYYDDSELPRHTNILNDGESSLTNHGCLSRTLGGPHLARQSYKLEMTVPVIVEV